METLCRVFGAGAPSGPSLPADPTADEGTPGRVNARVRTEAWRGGAGHIQVDGPLMLLQLQTSCRAAANAGMGHKPS
jgi:hypothetical protein